MPHVRIEVRKGWVQDIKGFLVEAVGSALVAELRIPEGDRVVRIIEYAAEDFALPPARSSRFTVISVDLFSGRTAATKRGLIRALFDNCARLGIPRDDIQVVLHEVARENWGVRGGVPASEVALGFTVDI